MDATLVERLELPPDAASVHRARSFVGARLAVWGCPQLTETATLLTSELATNAVRHARTAYAVVLTRTLSGLQVDVLDRSGALPHLRANDLGAGSGRGLALVACLASQWGATPPEDLDGYAKGIRFTVG